LEAARTVEHQLASRRQVWGWVIFGATLLIWPGHPGTTLIVCIVGGAIWARNLPRFPIGRCQICGTSLSGAVDSRCAKCGVRAGLEAEAASGACQATHRRTMRSAALLLLLVASGTIWLSCTSRWLRVELFNQVFTAQWGRVVYTTPAHEEPQWIGFDVLKGEVPPEPQLASRFGLVWPRSYELYAAWNYEVPMWLIALILLAALAVSIFAMRTQTPVDRTAYSAFVRFPMTRIRIRAAIRGISIILAALAANLILSGALVPSLS